MGTLGTVQLVQNCPLDTRSTDVFTNVEHTLSNCDLFPILLASNLLKYQHCKLPNSARRDLYQQYLSEN